MSRRDVQFPPTPTVLRPPFLAQDFQIAAVVHLYKLESTRGEVDIRQSRYADRYARPFSASVFADTAFLPRPTTHHESTDNRVGWDTF